MEHHHTQHACKLSHTDRVIEGGDSSCSGLNEEEYMSGHRHLNSAQTCLLQKMVQSCYGRVHLLSG